MDCLDKGTMGSSAEGEVRTFASASTGIVRYSSRDCCNEGTISSGEGMEESMIKGVFNDVVDKGVAEGGMEPFILVSSKLPGGSGFDEGSMGSYPDAPSNSIISSAP